MAKYRVYIERIQVGSVEVEADNEEQAHEKAQQMPLPKDWDTSSREIREELTEEIEEQDDKGGE
jgi:F420-0:gamma-glutamyl ligase